MTRYLIRRLGLLIPTLLGILIAVFVIMRLIPGDPARIMAGERATPERVEQIRHSMGLDQPKVVQFARFMGGVIRGDLGRSLTTRQPVLDEIRERYPATVELTLFAMLFATITGILMGVISAVRRNSLFDWGTMGVALIGVSMPVFWLGLVLMMVFAVELRWLPAGGRLNARLPWDGTTEFILFESLLRGNWVIFKDVVRHIILPAVALGTIPMSIIARMTRSSVLEVLNLDYIRTARAKGLSERVVIFRHCLKNAFLPVITIIGLQVGFLLGGAVLTETIFSWPGIGRFTVQSIGERDYPVVQGTILLVAFAFVLVNLVVDLLYTVVDPRIRYQ